MKKDLFFKKHGVEYNDWMEKYDTFKKLSYSEAVVSGQRVYWGKSPCSNGHHWWRYVSGRACVICNREASERQEQKKQKNDSQLYSKRPLIDRYNDDKALREATREVWEDV